MRVGEGVKGRARDFAAVFVLAALTLAQFGTLLLGTRVLYFGDLTLYFEPLLAFQRAELLRGRIPLWNPNILCGTPFVGNPQAWPLYPSSALLYPLSAAHATGAIGAFHLFAAALGTYCFLRVRTLGRFASLFGAIAWGFGGALVSKMQFPNMVQAAAYLPWLLWGIERLRATDLIRLPPVVSGRDLTPRPPLRSGEGESCNCGHPPLAEASSNLGSPSLFRRGGRGVRSLPETTGGRRMRSAALLAVLVGLSLLAAHPQMTLMQAYVCVAWALFRVRELRSWRERRAFLGAAGGAAVLGGLLASGQLLPVAELTRGSIRAGLTLAHANRFILPGYVSLYNFLLPNFFGNPATTADYVARGNFWEPCCYAGLLAVALAIGAAVTLSRHSPEVRFWVVVAIVGVWLSLGRDAGLFAVAFRVLPGVAKFHDPARWLHIATFALACLTAHGLEDVLRGLAARPYMRWAVAVAILAINTLDLVAFTRTLNPVAPADLFATISPIPAPTRAYFADERLLWGRFVSYRTYDTERGVWARLFAASDGPNAGTTHGFTLVGGYEPVQGTAIADRLVRIADVTGAARDALLRRAGASAIITLDRRTSVPLVRTLAAPTSRAWSGNTPLAVADVSPDEVTVHRALNGAGGTVFLADTAYPGWNTTDDEGQPVALRASSDGYREFDLPPDAPSVTLRYCPTSWRLGLFLTLFASGILTAIAGHSLTRRGTVTGAHASRART